MGHNRTVLLVEDDAEVARAILRALLAEGFEPTIAPSCAAARGALGDFDLGVFDIQLRDGLGSDVASAFLAADRVQRVVFFTASWEEDQLCEAARMGTVVFKRFGIPALIEELSRGAQESDCSRDDDNFDESLAQSGFRRLPTSTPGFERPTLPGWHFWRDAVS